MDRPQLMAALEQVAYGNAAALQCLIVHYHANLRRRISAAIGVSLRHLVDADDVLQQAYVSAFKDLSAASTSAGSLDDPQPVSNCGIDAGNANARSAKRGLEFENPTCFLAWLRKIGANELKNQKRALHRKKRDVRREVRAGGAGGYRTSCPNLLHHVTAGDGTPSRHVARDEAVGAVLSGLARLSADQRDVVRMRFLEGRPVPEVAKRLQKTEAAVHALCYRGLKALRQSMASLTNYLTRL